MCGKDKDCDRSCDCHNKNKHPWNPSWNAPWTEEEHDRFHRHVDNVKDNLKSLTNTMLDVSSDLGKDLNERARRWSLKWLNNDDDDEKFNSFFGDKKFDKIQYEDNGKFEFPSFYQARDVIQDVTQHPIFGEIWNAIPGFGSFRDGRTPFGYYAYKGPSMRQYHNCLEKNGKSIWDDKGYWRCLFPNGEIPVDMLNYKKKYLYGEILTKEDFYDAMKELSVNEKEPTIDLREKGTFFNKFDDYLNWKHVKYSLKQVEQQRRIAEQQKLLEERKKQAELAPKGQTVDKRVVSTSVKSHMYSDSETNETKMIEEKVECFNDGTCTTTKVTKSRPFDSNEWVTVEETHEDKDKNGWFWK
ncbi:uncharacterized protein SPAPADRAFT_59761 [Spathaspora passalidarum NRRL Y-27907]|uniref:Uncharacterized protein n=1 Tax=Spathaspora passalidarum (strain NRRL Y-27907 / 11-Y1) TaxID=619300 RepID=G3AI36_SPAPN|nr:uncharacterized protein SPAPADRAFT_59761 [Spathaspora passalidarum NRRL Y-27907]EGW34350.1 hypothetical protein SPAPADRAFT_59761 [Spathaspora passalidarum NRRL Y-27907]